MFRCWLEDDCEDNAVAVEALDARTAAKVAIAACRAARGGE